MIEDRPADDVYAGRLVAEQGYEVKLLPYIVHSVADFKTMSDLLHKRTRWMTVQRLMRPWGHFGLIFTWGLPWALVAVATHPTAAVALAYLGGYALCRVVITWMIGVWGMKQNGLWKKMPLIPLWDAHGASSCGSPVSGAGRFAGAAWIIFCAKAGWWPPSRAPASGERR